MSSVYSVEQVNRYIKNMFTQDFMLSRISVGGEVSNCKYHSSGHIYFSLKDGSGSLACVMFAGQRKGLAFAMKNLNLVIDAPIILSGYLAPYFTEEDIEYLTEHLHTAAPFILDKTQILVGTNGQYTPAIGAALHYVEKFIQSV